MNIAGQKCMVTPRFPAEALEARITPTVFFLSGGFQVKDALGAVVAGNTSAAGTTGADLAIPLGMGDALVLDSNGNLQVDSGEIALIKVTGGRALAFFKDLDDDSSYDEGELTGLAFGGVFGGKVAVTVFGSIVALLDETGKFTTDVVTNGTIKGLWVDGYVSGDVLAGGPIKDATIGRAGDEGGGVGTVATGTATGDRSVSFDGGTLSTILTSLMEALPGAAPSITKLALPSGASRVLAGEGGDITDLTVQNLYGSLTIAAGYGQFFEETYSGGAGGKVTNVKITAASDASVEISAGSGAYGQAEYFDAVTETVMKKVRSAEQDPETPGVDYEFIEVDVVTQKAYALAGAGGAGGNISGITLTSLAGNFDVILTAGDGGNGAMISVPEETETVTKKVRSPEQDPETPGVEYDFIDVEVVKHRAYMKDAKGGTGGSIFNVTLEALGGNFGTVDMSSRPGGRGAGNQVGGANGAIDHITSHGSGLINYTSLKAYSEAGSGDISIKAKGIKGGSVSNVTLHAVESGLDIWASGGTGGTGGDAGGAGGVIEDISVGLLGSANVSLFGGDGGHGSELIGQKKIRAAEQDPTTPGTEFEYVDVVLKSGGGGNGGSVSKISLTPLEAEGGVAEIFSGYGGEGYGSKSGGKAGAIHDIGFGKEAVGRMSKLMLFGGRGGGGAKPVDGGSIFGVTGSYGTLEATSGEPGGGGSGGDIYGLKGLVVDFLKLVTASGEKSYFEFVGVPNAGKSGNGGDIKNIVATVRGAAFLETGYGGDGWFIDGEIETRTKLIRSSEQDPDAPGVEYDEVEYDVIIRKPKAGASGSGGTISGVTITAQGDSPSDFLFTAGAGGNNDATSEVTTDKDGNPVMPGVGGAGGTIKALKILMKEGALPESGSMVALYLTGGRGGDGSWKGGLGGSVQVLATIPQTLDDLALSGGAGGGGLTVGGGGSVFGKVTAAQIGQTIVTPGIGAPEGKNKLVLVPPLAAK